MLACGQQIEAELADDLNEDILWLHNQQAAACRRSDGDGGTLQVRIRQPNEGVNAADGNVYIAELRHRIT